MDRRILITAAILGVLGIVLGAFAAHGLEQLISEKNQTTFETGVRYQMYHALLLLFIGNTTKVSRKTKALVFYLIVIGLIFFSGSIYGLATNDLSGFNFKSIALITPIGGLLLIASWVILLFDFIKMGKD